MHDPASATALGLTCKTLYKVYRGTFYDPVRLNLYTRNMYYMPLHQLIRGFFSPELVYFDGGYDRKPIFLTKQRLEEVLKEDEEKWAMVNVRRSY